MLDWGFVTFGDLTGWLPGVFDAFSSFLVMPTSNLATFVSALTVVIGGIWVWRDSKLRDKYFPKIEFLVDVLFKVDSEDDWIVEAVCSIRNRGIVRFSIADLEFELRGLRAEDPLDNSNAKIDHQTYFPTLLKEGVWYSARDKTFVEAETTQFYRHVTTVPKSFKALLIHGRLSYSAKIRGRAVKHSADRLIRIPSDMAEAKEYLADEKIRIYLDSKHQDIPASLL